MLLSIPERYALIPLLPERGDFQTLTRVKNLRTALVLGDEESKARGLLIVGEQIVSDEAARARGEIGLATEIPMHPPQEEMVTKALKGVEAAGELPMSLLDLYQRIVLTPANAVVHEAEDVASRV